MLLQQLKATRPRRWSRRLNNLIRRTSAVLIALVMMLGACADEPGGTESDQEVLEAEADRLSESRNEEIQEMDDERSVERRIRDATVAAKIRTALVESEELRRFDFEPIVVNGRVMLRGEVGTQDQRRRAVQIAEAVEGVRGVINEVSATEEPTPDEPDDAARDSMIAALEADAARSRDSASATAERAGGESKAEESADEAEDTATYHTVTSGESLWIIANKNGVSIDQIRRLNSLRSDRLKPGQRLRVK